MPPSTGSFNLKEKEVQLLRAVLTQVGDQVNAKNLSGELNITPNAASMRWLRFKDRFLGDINAAVAQGKDGVREGSMTANNPNSPANSPKTPALISDLGDAGKHRKRARDELGGYEADSLSSPEAMKNVKKTRRSKIKKEGSDDNEALERAIKEEFFDASEA